MRAKARSKDSIVRGALLSKDELFRYRLWRHLGEGKTVAFIMLNPSTADALKDDATIRRCLGYARAWGFSRLEIGNLFAYRTVSPAVLKREGFQEGRENREHLEAIALEADLVVAAWGSHASQRPGHAQVVLELLRRHHQRDILALGFNQDGTPSILCVSQRTPCWCPSPTPEAA